MIACHTCIQVILDKFFSGGIICLQVNLDSDGIKPAIIIGKTVDRLTQLDSVGQFTPFWLNQTERGARGRQEFHIGNEPQYDLVVYLPYHVVAILCKSPNS